LRRKEENQNFLNTVIFNLLLIFVVVERMSEQGKKRKLNSKLITEKYDILKEVDKGNSAASIAKKYSIPKQTLSNWLKNKERIYEAVDSNSPTQKRHRLRASPYENLDKACNTWLVNARTQNIPISTAMFKTKALHLAKELKCDNFLASAGWLKSWKKRRNVSFETVSGIKILYIFAVIYVKDITSDCSHQIEIDR